MLIELLVGHAEKLAENTVVARVAETRRETTPGDVIGLDEALRVDLVGGIGGGLDERGNTSASDIVRTTSSSCVMSASSRIHGRWRSQARCAS